ncbi:MAG: hypothetical protein AAGH46_09865 [Bacteroidota bacterium]
MKIVMIGHSGVGKTTYIASLYGALQAKNNGFSLRTDVLSDHHKLIGLSEQIKKGVYPDATAIRSEYKFRLYHDSGEDIKFRWADYRGDAVTSEMENEQASKLHKDIRKADGVMLFFDCELLDISRCRNKEKIKFSRQLGRIIVLLGKVFNSVKHDIFLSIVLTKSDIICRFSEYHLRHFEGLVETINANDYIHGSFIPISCGLNNKNIEMPLLFTLSRAVEYKLRSLSKKANSHKKAAEQWEEKSSGLGGFWREVKDNINGEKTDKQKAKGSSLKYHKKRRKYRALKKTVNSLNTYIQTIPVMTPEKDMQLYTNCCNGMGAHNFTFNNLNGFS